MHCKASQKSQWNFAAQLAGAVALAILVGAVFAVGATAIVTSVDFLFGTNCQGAYGDNILKTAFYLTGPLFGLGHAPLAIVAAEDTPEHSNTLVLRGIGFLANFVLVPIALIYAGVLHAYAAKIALAGKLPENQIGWMVSLFIVGGTASWLIAWPWCEKGHLLTRFFERFWFGLLIVPGGMLAMAVSQRLAGNGWTLSRYVLGVMLVWLTAMTLYLALRRNRRDIRAPIIAGAVLLMLGSIGPWGSHGVVAASQVEWLQDLLEKKGVLVNGRVTSKLTTADGDAQKEAASRLRALSDVNSLESLNGWLPEPVKGGAVRNWQTGRVAVQEVGKQIGVEDVYANYAFSRQGRGYFNATMPLAVRMDASGQFIGPLDFWHGNVKSVPDVKTNPPLVSMSLVGDEMVVKAAGAEGKIAIRTILESAKTDASLVQSSKSSLEFQLSERLRLVVRRVVGSMIPRPELQQVEFWVLVLDP